jgi:hypothetical protein
VTGDVRYTSDRKTAAEAVNLLYTNTPYIFNTGGQILPKDYRFDKSRLTYTASLSYKIPGAWGDLLYVKYGTGYRAGGFNFGNTPPLPLNAPGITPNPPVGYAPVIPVYGEETTESYEAGFKGAITANAYLTIDAYVSTTRNALAAVGDGCANNNACETGNTNYTVNGGTVRGKGVEAALDARANLLDGVLSLQATVSNQTAKYVSVPKTFAGLPIVGSPVAQNPHWLASFTVNYRHPIGDRLEGFVNVVYHGQWGGVQDTVTPGFPANPLDDFQDVNLRAGLRYDRLELAVISNNVTNETHKLAQFVQANGVFNTVRWNLPRTIKLEATYKW